MKEITHKDYIKHVRRRNIVTIGNVEIKLQKNWNVVSFEPPKSYSLERTSVWSFPCRGEWATHRGDFRGNWSPYIPRNLILRYTKKNDYILDQMMGSGTTLIEAKLLERNAIGVDININAVMVTRDRLNFSINKKGYKQPRITTFLGDARKLDKIPEESIDLIATHPPYGKIIPYASEDVHGDLSQLPIEKYLKEMYNVAAEAFRVLKSGKICAILVGDTRRYGHYVPLSFRVLEVFLEVGFILKEDIIKLQWNMRSTREKWRGKNYEFYPIVHEHLFIFRKPSDEREYKKYKLSRYWKKE